MVRLRAHPVPSNPATVLHSPWPPSVCHAFLCCSGEVIHSGRCASLKRHKLEVETVGKGTECGVLLEGFDGVQPGDQLQCIAVELRGDETVNAGPENKW